MSALPCQRSLPISAASISFPGCSRRISWTPIYGRLADVYGRKRVFIFGASLFLVASTACGFAWGMVPLIVLRTIQGFGSGAIQPIAWTILGDVYPPKERAMVQGYLSAVFGTSAIAGPLLGGFIVEKLSWPLVFWINIPVSIAGSCRGGMRSIISARCC